MMRGKMYKYKCRYKDISESEWFKNIYHGTSIGGAMNISELEEYLNDEV